MESYLSLFLFIALAGVMFYFFFIRPEGKAKKEKQLFADKLQNGDKVITQFGVYGTIDSMADNTIVLKMLDGRSMMKVEKDAVTRMQEK